MLPFWGGSLNNDFSSRILYRQGIKTMAVDLSKVNISLDQFQNIASGKYNAGEV